MTSLTNYKEKYEQIKVLYGNNISSNDTNKINLYEALAAISSKTELKKLTEELRSIEDKDERRTFKKDYLDYFVIGEFSGNERSINSFQRTEHAIFDYDNLEDFDSAWDKITSDQSTFCAFRSPSGDGIKVICRFSEPVENAEKYTALYKTYAGKFSKSYGIRPDNTSDAARACFYSYDPDMYHNPDAETLDVNIKIEPGTTIKNPKKREELLKNANEGIRSGENRTPVLTEIVGMLLHNNIDRDFALAFAKGWNKENDKPHTEKKIEYTVNDIYERYYNGTDAARTENFYSYDTSIYEAGIIGDEFFFSKIGEKKLYSKLRLKEKDEQQRIYDYIVNNKHLFNLSKINTVSNFNSVNSSYSYDKTEGAFNVYIAPRQYGGKKDNDFIENYLEETFGKYKDFIKKWMAVYFFDNHRKLPFLIFSGERGTGKNTFAEMIASVFPTLSITVKEIEAQFNPYAESKLVIIDEGDASGKIQYQTLKKLSGQEYLEVNKKYLPQYRVRNNINLIYLSNELIPIYVERNELPTNEKNNQFFVYKFKKLNKEIDPELSKKLRDRLYHYIDNELRVVFENLEYSGCRYSIPLPITQEEKNLFENNITQLEEEVENLIDKMEDNNDSYYQPFFKEGYLPAMFFRDYTYRGNVTTSSIVKKMQKLGYLEEGAAEKSKMLNGKRPRCYKMTDKLKEKINNDRGNQAKIDPIDPKSAPELF